MTYVRIKSKLPDTTLTGVLFRYIYLPRNIICYNFINLKHDVNDSAYVQFSRDIIQSKVIVLKSPY